MIQSSIAEGARVVSVLHCVASLHPHHGGPSRTVVRLTDALAGQRGTSVQLLSQGHADAPTVPSRVANVERQVVSSSSRFASLLGLPIRKELHRLCTSARPDLVHSHGLWQPANHWAARVAKSREVPLVIHPRGMLEPWALEQKVLRKRLALSLYQRADLAAAKAFVATSDMEYKNLRALGLNQPVAVIPNGVDVIALSDSPMRQLRTKRSERVLLFLSRVHPIKGLMELVQAWAEASPTGWLLRIAGPDENGHWGDVAQLVEKLGLGESVDYVGPVEASRVSAMFREADLFVLPSFSENFGLVVAEALAHGVPVITTRGTPWSDLETNRCGWWIETGVDPLAVALRQATALGDAERAAMGERGRAYVARYDWNAIAARTLALYHWLLGSGERPECVRLE